MFTLLWTHQWFDVVPILRCPKLHPALRLGCTPVSSETINPSAPLAPSHPRLRVLGGPEVLMQLCRASLTLFDRLFRHQCETSVSVPAFCLQLEVSQLEGSLQQPKAQSAMSPYLVPDTQALCQHLAVVKQLAASGRFIIIIPRTGTGAPFHVK